MEVDGEIKENKPLYFPGLDWYKDFKLSVIGPKDVKVLQLSMQLGIHNIVVSCVESKDDILYVRKVLGHKGQHIKLIAKLQNKAALENLDDIINVSDGIIIARAYLGLSLELEDVVYIQKYIMKKCNLVSKPVMLSTQIMESMVARILPTRAEVVDISNAVNDGVDSLILSPETAIGKHYELAIETMSHICFESEKHVNYMKRYQETQRLIRLYHKQQGNDFALFPAEETISSCAVKASFDIKA